MPADLNTYQAIQATCMRKGVDLIAVSKLQPVEKIKALYDAGHRDFGENYVQELVEKHSQLPDDIRWHFIGHLQSNKVKLIAPFVHLIHGVDSASLMEEILRQASKIQRTIPVLLQVHISDESTKFGFDEAEVQSLYTTSICRQALMPVTGLMGMASFTDNQAQIREEFKTLASIYNNCKLQEGSFFNTLSMGMSSDYMIAIEEGSNLIRLGTLLFGDRS